MFSLWCYLHNIHEDLFFADSFETESKCSRAFIFHIFLLLVISAAPQKNRLSLTKLFRLLFVFQAVMTSYKFFFERKTVKNKNVQYFPIYYFFLTCLTRTFFITTIGESAGKELLVVTGHGQGPSSAFQHNAFSTSSESVCSIALRHSELPSARGGIQLSVVSYLAHLLPPFCSTILLPFN